MRHLLGNKIALILLVTLLTLCLVPVADCFAGKGGDIHTKKLTRDMKNAKIGGVCAGIADFFDIDVSLVRIGWVIFTLCGGAGILAYLICWIVIPAN